MTVLLNRIGIDSSDEQTYASLQGCFKFVTNYSYLIRLCSVSQ